MVIYIAVRLYVLSDLSVLSEVEHVLFEVNELEQGSKE